MMIVVDASVCVKWFIEEDYSDKAEKLLEDFANENIDLYAPKTLIAEFSNAIRKYVIKGFVNFNLANLYIEKMSKIPIEYIAINWNFIRKAYEKALELSITVYDALYVVVAENIHGIFITADTKLYNQLKGKVKILHIRDY